MERAHASAAITDATSHRMNRHPLRAGSLACGAAALALLLAPAIHRPQLRLVWNASASVPIGLYGIDSTASVRVGDLVALRPSPALGRFMADRQYVEANALLIKPVAAAGGATVCRSGERVTINARPVASELPRDRVGRPLPTWSGCRRLSADQLFLIAPDRRASFDSRYFGSIDRRRAVGRALPLWIWP